MAWLRTLAPVIAILSLLAFALAGCKTTKIIKEYDDQPEELEESPTDQGPKPPPT